MSLTGILFVYLHNWSVPHCFSHVHIGNSFVFPHVLIFMSYIYIYVLGENVACMDGCLVLSCLAICMLIGMCDLRVGDKWGCIFTTDVVL